MRRTIVLALVFLVVCGVAAVFYFKYKPATSSTEDLSGVSSLDDESDMTTNNVDELSNIELVKPAVRDPQKWGDARCNDGTPFNFVYSHAPDKNKDKWVIYLQGGGQCNDLNKDGTCRERKHSTPNLITTIIGPDRTRLKQFSNQGIFNPDAKKNPMFYNANKVNAHYCSSDLWTGSTATLHDTSAGKWYFSGKINVKAMLELLVRDYGLKDGPQTKILFVGTSAGGVGVDQNTETMLNMFPEVVKAGNLKFVSDGSFIVDYFYPGYSQVNHTGLVNFYKFWEASLNLVCEKDQISKGQPAAMCYLGKIFASYVTWPRLVQFSQLDKYQLKGYGINNPKDPNDVKAAKAFKEQTLQQLDNYNISWLFSGGVRPYHTLSQLDAGWAYGPSGNTYGEILNRFWNGQSPQRIIF